MVRLKHRFTIPVLKAMDGSRILGIRAGEDHKFLGVWVVVIRDRVFVRSWNNKAGGWYRAFLNDPNGMIQIGNRQISVRAKPVSNERLLDAIDDAYAAKYKTPSSLQYVRGFRHKRRRMTTIEFVPR